ncbi:hypothetical protein J6590_101805 [Homalodisca vitripennis]|nr:hypothetical protein J6590_101805 [Homalodisca vitripennis]
MMVTDRKFLKLYIPKRIPSNRLIQSDTEMIRALLKTVCRGSLGPGHDTSGERRASSVERHSSVTRAARVVTIQAARVCCNMPSSEDLVHLLLLSENPMLKRRVVRGCKRGIKRWGVHPINRRRRVYGEYHHLIKQLKEDPERFFQYTRMSVPTFDFILNRLKGRLEKKRIGSRGSCSSAILNRLKTVERSMTHLSVERRTKSNRAGFGGAFDAKRRRSLSLTAQVYRDTPLHICTTTYGARLQSVGRAVPL